MRDEERESVLDRGEAMSGPLPELASALREVSEPSLGIGWSDIAISIHTIKTERCWRMSSVHQVMDD